ncbi:hypothetical protein E2562_030143 [Oryza meyeriana var. granulata]|uniref:Uncharacterized protein n=1 Tax=Oryza meyeriana var. granulata TaxID=110450 RepID=A0A6G1BPA7_9ORYZ|nr:hypothetical protein E2562_030143 [Oryza meyeriana var. granulata]
MSLSGLIPSARINPNISTACDSTPPRTHPDIIAFHATTQHYTPLVLSWMLLMLATHMEWHGRKAL